MRALPALSFILGVWLVQQSARLVSLSQLAFLIFCSVLLAAVSTRWIHLHAPARRHILYWLLASGAMLLIGFSYATWRADLRLAHRLDAKWQGQVLPVVGVVSSLPKRDAHAIRFQFDVEQVLHQPVAAVAGIPRHLALSQYLQTQFPHQPAIVALPIEAGQRWLLWVKLKPPHGLSNPGGRDSEAWALMQDVGAVGSLSHGTPRLLNPHVQQPQYQLLQLRARIAQKIDQVLDQHPYAGILRALAIGDDSAIASEDWQVFIQTGVNHLISISGLHITMIASVLAALVWHGWRRCPRCCQRVPAGLAAALAGVCVAFAYALLAGFSIPTQRTVYMLACFALAQLLKRQMSIMQTLLFAALVVVIVDPWAVITPGFYLSFAAVALFIYALSQRLGYSNALRNALATQWVATLGLAPLVIFMFQQLSLISPLANALAIPMISLAVVPLTLIGSLLPIDAALHLAHTLMQGVMHALHALAALDYSYLSIAHAGVSALILAMLGVMLLLLPKGFPLRYCGLCLWIPMLAGLQPSIPMQTLRVSVLDVGQGLSVVVSTAHHHLLYDAGPSWNSQQDAAQQVILPYLNSQAIRALDRVIISHHDSDHYGGMESLLKRVPTHSLLTSFDVAIDANRLLAYQARCRAGQQWDWDGVHFEMLYPDAELDQLPQVSDNDRSCVLKVSNSHTSVLLTGDIEAWAERRLLDQAAESLSSQVLVIPHHGSKTSSSPAFIDAVRPQWAVATVGFANRYRHPKAEIMQRYQQRGVMVMRSDHDGAVQFDIPAHQQDQIHVRSWRQSHARYWHYQPKPDE